MRELVPQPAVLELTQTPFFPQEIHHCGPAALATVLSASGASATPEILAAQVYIPEREGSLQAELVAATRRAARVPVVLPATERALMDSLRENRPVLVLQNLGLKALPRWHYAVVVGYDIEANTLILRSGREPREQLGLRRFLKTWERAERWAIVVARPEDPPQHAGARAWIAAVAPFESLGRQDLARTAYEAAVRRWPHEPLAWQALANTRYAMKDLAGSEAALREALRLAPDAVTRNNLAQVLMDRGCIPAALAQLDAIGDAAGAHAATVAATRLEAQRLAAISSGQDCSP